MHPWISLYQYTVKTIQIRKVAQKIEIKYHF